MANQEDEFSCPICLDTLTPPIRITICGHNFCHDCLKDLCSSSQQAKCPNCRKALGVRRNELNNLTRNRLLEEAIEKLNQTSGNVLVQLKEAALTYMRNKQYDEALQILRTIILKELGTNKIVSLLQMIRCQVELGQTFSAVSICNEVVEIIKSQLNEIHQQARARSCEELKKVIARFIKLAKMDTAIMLLQSHFNLVKNSYTDEIKLFKLRDLGYPMKKITQNLQSQNSIYTPSNCYSLLDEILLEMQNLYQIDPEVKTREIVALMKYYGCCCNNLHNYSKSINLFNQAIFFMKSIFGDYAANYQLHGHCHHNLALALERTIKFDEAKSACDEAINVYEQANDWENVQQKNKSVSLVSQCLCQINFKRVSYDLFWKTEMALSPSETRKWHAFSSFALKKPKYPIATSLLSRSQSEGRLRRSSSGEF